MYNHNVNIAGLLSHALVNFLTTSACYQVIGYILENSLLFLPYTNIALIFFIKLPTVFLKIMIYCLDTDL